MLFVVVACLVADPDHQRSVTGAYRLGPDRFWSGEDIYAPGIHGYLYAPWHAVAYTPFILVGQLTGDILWRLLGVILLATGVWRLTRSLAAGHENAAFFVATALALPAAYSAVRNGQANVHLGALTIHAALDVAKLRWTRATVTLILAVVIKPLGMVPVLLHGALERPMAWRLAIGFVFVVLLPFAFANPTYVFRQYQEWSQLLGRLTAPGAIYTDGFGALQYVGWNAPEWLRTTVRVSAALLTLAFCLQVRRRGGVVRGAHAVLVCTVVYLMLFNPVTEKNAYVMLGAIIASYAAAALANGRRGDAVALTVLCLLLGIHLLQSWPHQLARQWLKPLVALAFGAYFVARTWRNPERSPVAPAEAAPPSGSL